MTGEISFKTANILSIKSLNHNVKQFTIKKPIYLNDFIVSSFIFIKNSNGVFRPYTPICVTDDTLVFAIKIYPEGRVTKYLNTLQEGDSLQLSDVYYKRKYELNKYSTVCMIAGGTGITPMLQILKYAYESNSTTRFTVLFANINKDNIFLKDLLEKYTKPEKIFHFLSEENIKEDHFISGHFSRKNLNQILLRNNKKVFDQIFVCGPPGMMELVSGDKEIDKSQGPLNGILKELGYSEKEVYKF